MKYTTYSDCQLEREPHVRPAGPRLESAAHLFGEVQYCRIDVRHQSLIYLVASSTRKSCSASACSSKEAIGVPRT